MSRTRAILEVLSGGGGEGDVERGVLKVFGASSIEDCLATYRMVGAAERSALDEAVERVTANAGAAFLRRVEAVAPLVVDDDRPPVVVADDDGPPVVEDPYADLVPADYDRAPQPAASGMSIYQIRRQILMPGRSYWVEDGAGARVFRIAGKVRFARTFSIKDASGNVLYSVREKLLAIDRTFHIRRDGTEVAVLTRTTTSGAINDKFEIALPSGGMLRALGKLWQDEGVQIVRDGACVATIRRQQYVLRELFHASVHRSQDQALLLAMAMAIAETDLNRGST